MPAPIPRSTFASAPINKRTNTVQARDLTLAVILPVRNEDGMLGTGLAPLMALTDVDELIVVDGESTDDRRKLATSLLDTARARLRTGCLSSRAGRAP